MFYPYVTISAAQARKSDDLRHAMSPFSLFLSFVFFGRAKNHAICEAMKDRSGASSKKKEKKEHLEAFGGAFRLGQPSCGVVT